MTITEREKALLLAIINEHIKTSRPVGSNVIVEKHLKGVSSATVRNEMVKLEVLGMIEQPHTSAGRIPTTRAYQYYVDKFLNKRGLPKIEQSKLTRVNQKHKGDNNSLIREIAKEVADMSSGAVIVGFAPRDLYYTGISNLFRQPEFETIDLVHNFSEIIDHLDDVMEELFPKIGSDIEIMVGSNNPFGVNCGALVTKYDLGGSRCGTFGILGPVRMPYERNRALLEYARQLISK
ncbi:hypothetical protein KKG41_04470 [Patescibacteria group bacterium]|nr:hypothetical protein [Patescibacteria group bacterium]MBU1889933.1 hypothetical protein [Patescibacteria group bacterium]